MPVFTQHIILYFSWRNLEHFKYKDLVVEEPQTFTNRSLVYVYVYDRFITISLGGFHYLLISSLY